MHKNIVSVCCGCLFFISSLAQTNSLEKLLNEFEKNNVELKAYQAFIESQQLENRSGNNLPDPQLSAYYLADGENKTTAYTEYQISQSFEFPTVYSARGKWNDMQKLKLESAYAMLRQDVLLKATKLLINIKVLNKQKQLEQLRQEQGKRVYDQVQQLYKNEQVGILDLNKAKISWIQEQFNVNQLDVEIKKMLLLLQKINGGVAIDLSAIDLDLNIEVENLETLWQTKITQDPALQMLQFNEAAASQKVKLEQHKTMPSLTAGYNYQGVSGNNYSGVFGGISIPLWNSKNKVKAARAGFQYQKSQSEFVRTTAYSGFKNQYNQYQLLHDQFIEYQTTLETLSSEALLLKAYTLGELSFMDYYLELRFYRVAFDKMLLLEKELFQLKAEILKHQL